MHLKSAEIKLQKDISVFSEELRGKFFKLMRRFSEDMQADFKKSISVSGLLENGKRTTSNPYEPPYKVSGNLLASSGVLYEQYPARAVIKVGSDTLSAPYAVYLEYGSARMLPRPYILPCAAEYFNKICAALPSLKEEL